MQRSGPEWEQFRNVIEQPLKKCVNDRFHNIEGTCEDFVRRIERIRNRVDEVSPNFKYEIYKWCMECLCTVTVNRKVGFLDQYGLSSASEASRLLESLHDATEAIRKCEHGECILLKQHNHFFENINFKDYTCGNLLIHLLGDLWYIIAT